MNQLGDFLRSRCTVPNVKRRLRRLVPIIEWAPKYTSRKALSDLIAGLAVGMTVIPQGLAYAQIARLPTSFGLYAAFMGPFMYCLFGTSKDISLGPTAIMSALVAGACGRPRNWPVELGTDVLNETSDPNIAIMLSLFTGLILTVIGLFGLGFMVNFISHPVITGFICAASITISAGQLKHIFGLHIATHKFFPEMIQLFMDLPKSNYFDIIVGFTTMLLIFGMKLAKRKLENNENVAKPVQQLAWFVGTARNAIVVIMFTLISLGVNYKHIDEWQAGCPGSSPGHANCTVFTLTKIKSDGLPNFTMPLFTYDYKCNVTTDANNGCRLVDNEPYGLFTVTAYTLIKAMGSSLAIIPLMAYLESISIAKGFAVKNDYRVDTSQELIAIGISNFMGAFVSSYTVTGSFSRSSVNDQSSVATPGGGIYVGGLVLMAIAFLTPAFVYIPSATLGGVIIMAASQMFDYHGIKEILSISKLDFVPFLVTFVGCLIDTSDGILIGIATHLVILLFHYAVPIISDFEADGKVKVEFKSDLYFPRKAFN